MEEPAGSLSASSGWGVVVAVTFSEGTFSEGTFSEGGIFSEGRQVLTMPCRGVRGATTAEDNSAEAILRATRQLLAVMIRQNGIVEVDVASAIFTTTTDLDAEFPALAARQLGWLSVALMCGHELDVPGSLRRCVRILLHWNTDKPPDELVHIYIKEAASLRPDCCKVPPVDWDELENWIAEHLNDDAKPSHQ